ncbi:M20/M25/M40 family metallo-hydrolase [uncultured Marivirga sp.]|uniref:M28 family metallopeptidase n=1 Tax=uncultured Marivirga sp. TaxID=1123707 RepID=UPI0030EE1F02|tara:strand:+ start:261576 stop:262805 length:1230 start_codon:yes stop_codon:yes gene_type:complete
MRNLFTLLLLLKLSLGLGQSSLAREHLRVLTSDSLAGRGFTSNGQQKAADFIVEQLKSCNVQAGVEDAFRQELSYPVNTFPGTVQYSVVSSTTVKIYAIGKDFLFHSASAPMELEGEIKAISTEAEIDRKVKNQIFYIEKNVDNAKEVTELTQRFLFKNSAKGNLLIIQDSSKWSWFPSSESSENAVLYVKDKLPKHSKVSVINESKFISNFRSSNVVGKIKGQRSDSVIMLSAHYDHLGEQGNAVFKGANDNASGVVMLLALAKYFAENQPKFDTYFLFTTAEEIGLLGSYYFIENSPFDLRKINMLINLDMVGTGDEGIMVVNAKKQNQYFNLLKQLNKDRIFEIKARGEACNSDHCLFDRVGVPAVFIYTLGGKQAYHDIYDNGEDLSLEAFDDLHDLLIESLEKY